MMRQLPVVVLFVTSMIAVVGFSPSMAQEGTPPAGSSMTLAEGVVVTDLAYADGQVIPAQYQIWFEPGAVLMDEGMDPSYSLLYLEEGSLTFSVDAPIAVSRAGAEAPEVVEAGTTVTVEAGDYFTVPALTPGEYRNEGDEPAVAVVAALVPSGAGATPTAATPAG